MGQLPSVYLAVLVAACGSDPKLPDAMPDAAPRCDPMAPFAAPVPMDGINSYLDDVSARLSPDELTIVFARRQATNVWDLYQGTRESRDAAFGNIELLATVNSINSDLWPTLSPDGLTLMFDSDRGMPNMYHVYISRRADVSERFGPATAVAGLMTREVHPMLANAGSLYFTSPNAVRPGLGSFDIWRATVAADGTVGTPAAVIGGVNSADADQTPTLTDDELRIYFRRDVTTEADVYTASRSTVSDGFGAAAPVATLAAVGVVETPSWVSADDCNLYSYSDAPGGMGLLDIYVSRRGDP